MALDTLRRPNLCYFQKRNHVRIPKKAASKKWIDGDYVPCVSSAPVPFAEFTFSDPTVEFFQENTGEFAVTPSSILDPVRTIKFTREDGAAFYATSLDPNSTTTLYEDSNGVKYIATNGASANNDLDVDPPQLDGAFTDGLTIYHVGYALGSVTNISDFVVLNNTAGKGIIRHYFNNVNTLIGAITDQEGGGFFNNSFAINQALALHILISVLRFSDRKFTTYCYSAFIDEAKFSIDTGNPVEYTSSRLSAFRTTEADILLYGLGIFDRALTVDEVVQFQSHLRNKLKLSAVLPPPVDAKNLPVHVSEDPQAMQALQDLAWQMF